MHVQADSVTPRIWRMIPAMQGWVKLEGNSRDGTCNSECRVADHRNKDADF